MKNLNSLFQMVHYLKKKKCFSYNCLLNICNYFIIVFSFFIAVKIEKPTFSFGNSLKSSGNEGSFEIMNYSTNMYII